MYEPEKYAGKAGDKTPASGAEMTNKLGVDTLGNSQQLPENEQTAGENSNSEAPGGPTSEADGDDKPGADGDDKLEAADQNSSEKQPTYTTDEKGTYKHGILIANFNLAIAMIIIMVDCGEIIRRLYKMVLNFREKATTFYLPAEDFSSAKKIMDAVHNEVGPGAYLEGKDKDLLLAVRKGIGDIPTTEISLCTGFTPDFKEFKLPGMRVTPEGITTTDEPVVDLSAGNLSKRINFTMLSDEGTKQLVTHLIDDFAELKSHSVMYPVIAHAALSPFTSFLGDRLGKQPYAIHLKGASGGGKTLIAGLIASFSGDFLDPMASWSSTPNFIEAEGYHFKDLTFTLDDYKNDIVSRKDGIRIFQQLADKQGRGRLNSSLKAQKKMYIRGLLLSNGENFVANVESVTGRTIVLEIDSTPNRTAGEACRKMQDLYKGFFPRFVGWMISKQTWKEGFEDRLNQKIECFSSSVMGISNGLRISTSWGMNAVAFGYFCDFAVHIGVIDQTRHAELMAEYNSIVEEHLKAHEAVLKAQNPADLCFSILARLLATRTVVIDGLFTTAPNAGSDDGKKNIEKDKQPADEKKDGIIGSEKTTDELSSDEEVCTVGREKVIGKLLSDKEKVYIFSDLLIYRLNRHSNEMNQPVRFDKESLRASFIKDTLINQHNGRYSQQVRYNNVRLQAWQFDLDKFKERCIDVDGA